MKGLVQYLESNVMASMLLDKFIVHNNSGPIFIGEYIIICRISLVEPN
jgi:hypothetical protein